MHKRKHKMIYGILLIVGVIVAAIGVRMLLRSLTFIKSGERTTATVVEIIPVHGSDGTTYKPVFEFTTLEGRKMIHRQNSSSNPPGWKEGEETAIIYDRDNPENARVVTYFGLFSWSIILFAIAAPMIIIGGGYFLAARFF
ncbi:MAG TPA: DUF3592 domain-containing protein [Chitinophagaceae bacterium]|nr:DUF3592 domain-containing protein [Chitinophagaceae bacterium]